MSKQKIILLLFLATIPAIYWLLAPGFYEPHDLHHLADIHQMYRAFISGQIPPRLGPDFTFGYGYPLFNFYYLLPFYLGAFFYALFGSLTASFELVFVTSVLMSVYGMYLFLREFFDKLPSIAGSVLFLYTPYRAVQVYVRGAIGEALALSFLPFVLWALVKLIKNPQSKKAFALTAILSALFIILHNYLWALSLPFVLLLMLLLNKAQKIPLGKIAYAGLSAVGLTAYWWLPALLESKLVDSTTPFPLIDHFPFIKQLIVPSWGYGSSVWGPGDEISFQIGAVNLFIVAVIIGIGSFGLIHRTRARSKNFLEDTLNRLRKDKIALIGVWAATAFFISIFFMNIRSLFLWRIIPFHNFIQFPWRLLIFTTFFSSVLASFLVQSLPKKFTKVASLLIISGSIILTYSYFSPSRIVKKSDGEYLSRFFESSTYSEDYLLLPVWVKERPEHPPLTKVSVTSGQVTEIEEINPVHWEAVVNSDVPTTVIFHSYYFPGWNAKVDGKIADIKPGDPYGQIEVEVSKGEHKLEFFWRETNLRKIANYVSLGFVIIIAHLFLRKDKSVADA